MLGRAGIFTLIAVIGLLSWSCAKIPEEPNLEEGPLIKEELPDMDSIPLKWGKLISVSSVTARPHAVQLWYEDENGTLRIVDYHVLKSRFAKHLRVIPRK